MGEEEQATVEVPAHLKRPLEKLLVKFARYSRDLDRSDRVRLRAHFNWTLDQVQGMDTLIVTPERMADISAAVEWYEKRPRRVRRGR